MDQRTRVALTNSAHSRNLYRNRRLNARIVYPQPAIGGLPYNRRSVAELDPYNEPADRKPERYGYGS